MVTFYGGAAAAGCPTSAAFLARTSGLDATHVAAYQTLICGLVSDGIWTKFDVLRVYATQDQTTALLNLVSSSYTGTAGGSPTFTVDRGFTGVDGSSTVYIDSHFNPDPAISPTAHYVRDSAHISAWNITNTSSSAGGGIVIGNNGGPANQTNIIPKYSDGKVYFRINEAANAGIANANATGHYIANRSASNASQGYKDGASIFTDTGASVGPFNANIVELASDQSGAPGFGGGFQLASISIGASLSAGEVTLFYNRLRTYMTAVGVP